MYENLIVHHTSLGSQKSLDKQSAILLSLIHRHTGNTAWTTGKIPGEGLQGFSQVDFYPFDSQVSLWEGTFV